MFARCTRHAGPLPQCRPAALPCLLLPAHPNSTQNVSHHADSGCTIFRDHSGFHASLSGTAPESTLGQVSAPADLWPLISLFPCSMDIRYSNSQHHFQESYLNYIIFSSMNFLIMKLHLGNLDGIIFSVNQTHLTRVALWWSNKIYS